MRTTTLPFGQSLNSHPLLAAWSVVAAGLLLNASNAAAAPVSVEFQLDEPTSSLAVQIEARGFTDSDEQALRGTIDATLDFGQSGAFPAQAAVTVTGAEVAAVAPFEFRLGLPRPFPGADVTASGIVADVTTPSPPGLMTRITAPQVTYQFDASQFLISADEGMIVVTGFVDDTQDLAEEPVSGASPPGTLGTLTLTPGPTSGFYTRVDAALRLPVDITDVSEFGDPENSEEVTLDLDATVNATATFYVALAGVPGDFNSDARVDASDLPLWRAGFGMTANADADDGDADGDNDVDGADYFVWQRNLGTAPPPLAPAAAAPEPSAALLTAIVCLAGSPRLRRNARR
jgi:hypothetical protein